MIFNNQYSYVIRNGGDKFYRFYLSKQSRLMLDFQNGSYPMRSSHISSHILDFSVDIDENDQIHILLLKGNGDLQYEINNLSGTSRLLTHIDLNSFNIKFLTLKVIDNQAHIFYMLNQRGSSSWAIQHCLFQNKTCITYEAAVTLCEQHVYPYTVDCYKKNLYLFYSKDSSYTYCIKCFNESLHVWDMLDEHIEIRDSHSTAFIVNNTGTAFICYTATINRNIYTMVRYKALMLQQLHWSRDFPLSEPSINALHPSLVVKDGCTYVLWEEGNNIVCKEVASALESLGPRKLLSFKKPDIFKGIYLSTHPEDINFKSSFTHICNHGFPFPVINLENTHEGPEPVEKAVALDSSVPAAQQVYGLSREYNAFLRMNPEKKDWEIDEIMKTRDELAIEMSNLKSLLAERDSELEKLRAHLEKLQQDTRPVETVKSVSEKNDIDPEDSFKSLQDELNQKKEIIDRLNILVNALYQDNNSKEYQIQQLEERLNRGFFRRLFG
ncbi:MAG: hypothetical protein Q8930_17635 [Bacillota bacterium]|nr:hypothetical protein [Bacillota bacterium]